MSKIKLLIITFVMILTLTFAQTITVKALDSVYTISDTTYDEESGKLSYQKISYSKNTYTTTNCTELDAAGGSVDVSEDAQYVFFPARYLNFTSDTKVSFKFKNNGVQKILVHAQYSAGISSGGVDYKAGYKLVCMNALSEEAAWNVSLSKSVDGYDVFTIVFGGYAKEIYDISFTGFRLYFDFGLNVNETREFEVFGYEIHESKVIPTFASDPKPTRVGKLRSDDVVIENNTFTVNGTAKVTANILDSKPGYEALSISFRAKNDVKIAFKLDDETVLTEEYEEGKYTVNLSLNGKQYSKLEFVIDGQNSTVVMQSFVFKGKPYLDPLSGSQYTISKDGESTVVKYSYKVGWYNLTAPIREYNADYTELHIEFELAQPTLIGVMIDDVFLVNHWNKVISEAGKHSLVIDVTEVAITDSSAVLIYLDPEVSGYSGSEGEKTIIFTKLEFAKAPELPKAEVMVDPLFEFDYDGTAKSASGATTNSGAELTYEYKLEGLSDKYYDTTLPVASGTYDVRVVSPKTEEYGLTYAYSKLVIKKTVAKTPTSSILSIDYLNSKISYDSSIYVVSSDEDFNHIIPSGGYVAGGMTLYFKVFESANNFESGVATYTLPKNSETVDVKINYSRERTVDVVPNTVEYSTDGINWTSGTGARVSLEAGNIYLFRIKATNDKFAGEITYLAVAPRALNPYKLEVESTTNTSVILTPIDGAEYRLSDTVWQSDNEFTDLEYGSVVTIYMRIKGTSTSFASLEVAIELKLGQLDSVKDVEITSDEVKPEEPTKPEINYNDEIVVETESGVRIEVSNYNELTNALKQTNNVTMTTIVINGTIYLEYDITVKGKVTFIGGNDAVLVFEHGEKKRTMYNSKGSELRFENLTIKRSVTDETEGYLFRFHQNGIAWFTGVVFDVATLNVVSEQFDRVTYCPSGTELTLYFNNCTYNTEAYFYRGTMIFFNNEVLPKTAGKPTIYDFNGLKLDYETKTFKFPATIKVSEDEDFTETIKNGSTFASNTTYYAIKDGFAFEFKTKNLKLAKPNINSLTLDYHEEKVYFSDKYLVALDREFTNLVNSGDSVTPNMTLYVKRLAEGIYFESDVAAITLPDRVKAIQLDSAFICSFGFVMTYYENVEFSIGDTWQSSLVFVGLKNTTYTVKMRFKATDSTFASSVYETTVTLTK